MALLTPETIDVAATVLQWARDFLATEHPEMRRPGRNQVVCPFVGPALDSNSFYLSFHPEISGNDEDVIERLVLDQIEMFKTLGPSSPGGRARKALLLVFPGLPESRVHVLDSVHEKVKTQFVQNVLMLGQFYESCEERSVYNRAFRVSRSPVPLIAIRHMAVHDILFCGEDREWFDAYNHHFGGKFNSKRELGDYNSHLIAYYARAKEKWQQ